MINFTYDITYLLIQFALGFIITFGFAIFFNAPRSSLVTCSMIGAFAWLVYLWVSYIFNDIVVGTLAGAILVGITAGQASKKHKMPATVFIYTGIIPLIPGYSLYYTMHNLVLKHYLIGAQKVIDTLLQAGAIAVGILLASVFSESIKRVKIQRKRK